MSELLESQKKEVLLGVDAFEKPHEVAGREAWIDLILNLLNIKKGTYPSNPNMGVGLSMYEFGFMDDVINELEIEINDQIRKYLPDIPLDTIVIQKQEVNSEPILLIIINLTINGTMDTSVVAASTKNNILDFAVCM